MQDVSERPKVLEVKRSPLKFLGYILPALPLLMLGPIAFPPFVTAVLSGDRAQIGAHAINGVLAVISFVAWAYLAVLWRAAGMGGAFMRMTPEGLAMPSLGSEKPIPWADVNVFAPDGPEGRWIAIGFKLKVDPMQHKKVLGFVPPFRSEAEAEYAEFRVLSVFNLSRSGIFKAVFERKAFVALGEIEKAARLGRKPPKRVVPAKTLSKDEVYTIGVLVFLPVSMFVAARILQNPALDDAGFMLAGGSVIAGLRLVYRHFMARK